MRFGLFSANLLLMSNIVLRDQIVKEISKELSISQARTKFMVNTLESIIACELKTKLRVKIAHFGTFIVKTRASRTVKTVREQKTKIILQKEVIRFIAANQFKDQLMEKSLPDKTESDELIKSPEKKLNPISKKIDLTIKKSDHPTDTKNSEKQISIKIEKSKEPTRTYKISPKQVSLQPKDKSTETIAIQDPVETPKINVRAISPKSKSANSNTFDQKRQSVIKIAKSNKKIFFSPLSIYSRIERAKVETKIANRLVKLAKSIKPQIDQVEKLHSIKTHEKVFANFVMQAIKLKVKSLDFSLSDTPPNLSDQTILCAGRPRICLGKIPTLLLYQFISETADINDFHVPQLRFVTIRKSDNIKKIILEIHSFPIYQGTSIHVNML
jgi:nucleoid DNA-binding protein